MSRWVPYSRSYIDSKFTCPTPHTKGQPTSEMGGGPLHVWHGRPHLATDFNYPIVLDFPIFPALGNGGAQCVDFGSENRQIWGFSPLKFVRGHV